MSEWDWFDTYEWEAALAADERRVHLARLHREAYQFRESDPDRALALIEQGRQLAEQLREPWWILYYQQYRVHALLHFKQDFRSVLELAIRNTLELSKQSLTRFPRRLIIHGDLVTAYLGIDPFGHAEPIQQALDYLDAETPAEGDDRYLLLGSQRQFALDLERWQLADELTGKSLALAASDADRGRAAHFRVFSHSAHCEIGWRLRDWDFLQEAAHTGETLAQQVGHQVELAGFRHWLALVERHQGREDRAQRYHRLAVGALTRMRMQPDPAYRDAEAAFHEAKGELSRALEVREAEWQAICDRGRLHYECQVLLKRCRLRRQLGMLTEEDVARTRMAAGKLRQPGRMLEQLDRLAQGDAP